VDDSAQEEALSLVDHLIVPAKFACDYTGASHPADAVERLLRKVQTLAESKQIRPGGVTGRSTGVTGRSTCVADRSTGVADRSTGLTVVVTDGSNGAWFAERENRQVRHQAAFPVEATDTTGCGDVFHGAYAASLVLGGIQTNTPGRVAGQSLPPAPGRVAGGNLETRVRIAAAAAALKATKRGGQAGAPTRQEVGDFLARFQPAALPDGERNHPCGSNDPCGSKE